jgi:4'-phosphopantetheinyl transferase
VGVDVEAYADPPLDVAATLFATPERDALAHTAPADHMRAFFELWTMKEAFVKARGTGFRTAFDSFAVQQNPPGLLRYGAVGAEVDQWWFTTREPTRRADERAMEPVVRVVHERGVIDRLPAGT